MTRHKKHDDILDVQIRTKILDQYGNPIQGAIEYDPATGYGKRIKDPVLGLTEDFYCKDGSLEIDGQNFDDTNHDEDEVNSIKEMITLKVSRNDPDYHDMLKAKVNQKRNEKQQKTFAKSETAQLLTAGILDQLKEEGPFTAATQIAKGETVIIDVDNHQVKGTRSNNIFRPSSDKDAAAATNKQRLQATTES